MKDLKLRGSPSKTGISLAGSKSAISFCLCITDKRLVSGFVVAVPGLLDAAGLGRWWDGVGLGGLGCLCFGI